VLKDVNTLQVRIRLIYFKLNIPAFYTIQLRGFTYELMMNYCCYIIMIILSCYHDNMVTYYFSPENFSHSIPLTTESEGTFVTHVFIKKIFRAVELAPLFPLPFTGLCRGWSSSGSVQPQAVAWVMAMKQ
jgi:hypothetical protein